VTKKLNMRSRNFKAWITGPVALSLLACGGEPHEGVDIDDAAAQAERIERMENGLVHPLLGKAGPNWNLHERMTIHNVPGVSIAVIDDFEVVWSKGYGVRNGAMHRSADLEGRPANSICKAVLGTFLRAHLGPRRSASAACQARAERKETPIPFFKEGGTNL
jgi:hypothetical protein